MAQPTQQQKMELLAQLDILYGSAAGVSFKGTVVDKQTMHQKQWTVIEITEGVFFEQILKNIHSVGDDKVWKGITGPPDSPVYTNYRIWVELEAPLFYTANFKVDKGNTFPFKSPNDMYPQNIGYCFDVIPIPIPVPVSQAQ